MKYATPTWHKVTVGARHTPALLCATLRGVASGRARFGRMGICGACFGVTSCARAMAAKIAGTMVYLLQLALRCVFAFMHVG